MPDLFMPQWAFAPLASLPSLVLGSVLASVAVLTAAAFVAWLMSRASAAARHLVWCVGVVALVMLPLLSALLPTWTALPRWFSCEPDSRSASRRLFC